ncbi:MAG TPA: hypothetical protein PLH94_08485 [Fimbriimonadaceae bacterium]|nr:hypothetical protein [Fimbriimonadaceae bacterium]
MIWMTLLAMAPQPQPTAAETVSKMLRRYSDLSSLTGSITMTQRVGSATAVIKTQLQYERPSKLFIRQDLQSSTPQTWIVTSDGATFSYNVPNDRPGRPGERLIEKVATAGRVLNFQDIYAVASRSLGDRSFPTDIAISRLDDLRYLRDQWATLGFVDPQPQGLTAVGGQWREYKTAPASGTFEIWVDKEGNLRRYIQRETVKPLPNAETQFVTTVWDVDFVPNGKPNPDLFQVLK